MSFYRSKILVRFKLDFSGLIFNRPVQNDLDPTQNELDQFKMIGTGPKWYGRSKMIEGQGIRVKIKSYNQWYEVPLFFWFDLF
jgi:hypothetical protein